MNEELAKNLSKLIQTFNDKRVISEGEIRSVLTAIVAILAENKKGVESLNNETKKQLDDTLAYLDTKKGDLINEVNGVLRAFKAEVEKATKDQNARAFDRLQGLISKIKMPSNGRDGKDGKDGQPGIMGQPGKDGSPDTPEQIRDKLETLTEEERLDAKAIKNLPEFIDKTKKELKVGGIRFLENLADVSVPITDKRENLLIQYDETNKRWESGIAITVSPTAPTTPKVNDLWIDNS